MPSMSPALDGVGEAADDVALELGVRERRPFASGGGQARLERRTRAAQQAVDRRLAGLEHLGDLRGAEAEHVAQHEHRALLRREVLQADDERQRDRLLGLVARLRSGSLVRDALEQDVGVGLEPDRLARSGSARASRSSAAGPPGGAGSPAGRPASGWWRSGTARRGPTRAPRTARGRATRRAASPGAGPRRPAPSRRSGRCAAGAHAGRGRSARGTRPRRRRAHGRGSARSRSHPRTDSSFHPHHR